MTNQELIAKISILPEELQKELFDFVEFLAHKNNIQFHKNMMTTQRKSHYGDAKGLILISEDFDDPLDDFKDYSKN